MSNRYFVKFSFDGTKYNGWQIQQNTPSTVQQVMNDSISRLMNEPIDFYSCCRTDTGVHAKEMFAHFDCKRKNLHKDNIDWLYKFNTMLPFDVSVHEIIPVKEDANARFNAESRTYQYFISRERNPFLLNRTMYWYGKLDLDAMKQAAKLLFKYNDFSAFSKMNTQTKTNECKITEAKWSTSPIATISQSKDDEGELLVFTITADRFLRGMVRMIVGTMLEVGKKNISVKDFQGIIESKDCRNAGALVPACGLYLVKVEYPKKVFLKKH